MARINQVIIYALDPWLALAISARFAANCNACRDIDNAYAVINYKNHVSVRFYELIISPRAEQTKYENTSNDCAS